MFDIFLTIPLEMPFITNLMTCSFFASSWFRVRMGIAAIGNFGIEALKIDQKSIVL